MEPHFLSNGMTSAVKLHKIYSYLRDTVRLINAFKILWDKRGFEHSHEMGQDGFRDRKYRNMTCNDKELQHTRENVSGCSRVCYGEFTRRVEIDSMLPWLEMSLDV
jgi:hypothetical protein